MSRFFFLVFSLLLSFNSLAISTVFTINDGDAIRSDRVNLDDKNIIKIIGKDQSLQRLSMHYSGWSLVSIDDVNGWILSEKLTSIPPISDENNTNEAANLLVIKENLSRQFKEKIKILTQKNSSLEAENTRLNAYIVELKAEIEATNLVYTQPEGTPKNEEVLSKLENSSDVESLSKNDSPFSFMSSLKTNWIYLSIAILIVLLMAIFSIYSKNKRRYSNLNTIRRH